ncbi:hypothetical protein DV737_g3605, partial [Chaetothyriales sp. CBS 132003]
MGTTHHTDANSAGADEATLQNVARDGEMDYAKWPGIIDALLERLNQIAFNEFPIPRPFPSLSRRPPTAPLSPVPQQAHARPDPSQTIEAPEAQSALSTTSTATATSHPASSQPPTTPLRSLPPSLPPSQDANAGTAASQASPADALPAALAQLLQSITTTLRASFSHRPPHTIQRLAELVLEPRKHYKTLPAWLRAVDRVVNVSSSADIFPLSDGPRLINGVINGDIGGGILWKNDDTRNGSHNAFAGGELGSDESLGGALLTPIPWLRHDRGSSIEGDAESEPDTDVPGHGDNAHDLDLELDSDSSSGADNDHLVHGVRQDHLVPDRPYDDVPQADFIRMEQGAGTVLVPPQSDGGPDEEEPLPHARGPQVVGTVDMGKVDGKEVEMMIANEIDENDATAHSQDVLARGAEKERRAGSGADGFDVDNDGGGRRSDKITDDEPSNTKAFDALR